MLNPIHQKRKEVESLEKSIISLYNKCQYTKCIDECNKLANISTTKRQVVYLHLGKSLSKKGELEKAKQYLLYCAELFPACTSCFIELGEIFLATHKDEEALLYFSTSEELLKQEAEAADKPAFLKIQQQINKVNLKMAEIKFNLGEYDKAQELVGQVLQINKQNKAALLLQGDIYFKTEEFEQAEQSYLSCMSIDSDQITASYKLGCLYSKLERYDEAIQHLELCLSINNKYSQAYLMLGSIFSKMELKSEEAIWNYNKAIELEKEDKIKYDVLMSIGDLYLSLFKSKEAIPYYLKASQINTVNIASSLKIGQIYFDKNNFIEAADFYEKAIRTLPTCKPAFHQLGKCMDNLKRYNKSIAVYKNLLLLDPYNSDVFAAVAVNYSQLNNRKEADEFFRLSLQINPFDKRVQQMYDEFKGNEGKDSNNKIPHDENDD